MAAGQDGRKRLLLRETIRQAAALAAYWKEMMMQVPNNGYVAVADGRKLLFFRNEGDGEYLNLVVEKKEVDENPAHRDQATDLSGQAPNSVGGDGATMGLTDYHQLEESRFAAEAADLLNKRALANHFDSLVVVADPRTLGEMRKHYHKETEKRLTGEIAKDLTGHPVPQIEKVIQAS